MTPLEWIHLGLTILFALLWIRESNTSLRLHIKIARLKQELEDMEDSVEIDVSDFLTDPGPTHNPAPPPVTRS